MILLTAALIVAHAASPSPSPSPAGPVATVEATLGGLRGLRPRDRRHGCRRQDRGGADEDRRPVRERARDPGADQEREGRGRERGGGQARGGGEPLARAPEIAAPGHAASETDADAV